MSIIRASAENNRKGSPNKSETTKSSSQSRGSSSTSRQSPNNVPRKVSSGSTASISTKRSSESAPPPIRKKGLVSAKVNYLPVQPKAVRGPKIGGNILGGGIFGRGFLLANMHFLNAALKNLEPRIDDDLIDRVNYYYTPSIIIIFAILVSAKQYVGHPIECWVPAQFTKPMEQYTENYCWIQNTYWVPMMDLIPLRLDDRVKRQIGYYQWVPFILAIQAMMFYFPALCWRMLSTQSGVNVHGILQMACDEHNIEPDNRLRSIQILSRHIDESLQYQRDYGSKQKSVYMWACIRLGKVYGAYCAILYCFVKLMYLMNVMGQFFLLNRFLETNEYPFFGAHVLWDMLHGREWQNSGKFPRVTLCDFEIRVLGNIHRHTVQCVLVINMFTEKIFIFLWLWFLFLALIDSFSFVYWAGNCILPYLRISFIRKHLELADDPPRRNKDDGKLRSFVMNFLRPDGVFVLRMISAHAGTVMCSEIMHSLWRKFLRGKFSTVTDLRILQKPPLVDDDDDEVPSYQPPAPTHNAVLPMLRNAVQKIVPRSRSLDRSTHMHTNTPPAVGIVNPATAGQPHSVRFGASQYV